MKKKTSKQIPVKSIKFQSRFKKPILPSLASVLKPASDSKTSRPLLKDITPQYVDTVLRGALAGNHVQAWELFDLMIDTDPEIAADILEYVSNVLDMKLTVEPYTQCGCPATEAAFKKKHVVEACLRNMRPDVANDDNGWSETLRDILFARFYGQTVLEIDWHKKDGTGLNIMNFGGLGCVVVPRSTFWVHPICYAWGMNGRLGLRNCTGEELKTLRKKRKVSKKQKASSGLGAWNYFSSLARPSELFDFPPNKFLIGIDKFKAGTIMGSGSCLRTLAFWWVASIFGGDWLLNYAQLFGIPFRKAHCSPSTPEWKKAEIRDLLDSMGSAGYILLDNGNDLEFERAIGGAGESPQALLFNLANQMKRKVIMASNGVRFAESVINQQFIPAILNVNFGEGGESEAPTVKLVKE